MLYDLNDMDIYVQLILEFKNSFGKYHPVCPKNKLSIFWGHAVDNRYAG